MLCGIFPGREIACALVWTQPEQVAMLADALLDPLDPKPPEPNLSVEPQHRGLT